MPNYPVRNLGGTGIVSDLHPYDLPPNAFSAGVNVRFENGAVTRGPVMRRVHEFNDTNFNPTYVFPIPNGDTESLVSIGDDYGSVISVTGDTEVDITPAGISPSITTKPFVHTFLGNVAYINRVSHIPYMLRPGDSIFQPLEAWDSSWRCGSLRAYKDVLVALNVTKGGASYPSMVKWSDFAMFGNPPATWDSTATTNSSGENILNQMRGPIIDGCALRESFYIYGENEVWAMNYVGGTFMFDFRKRFDNRGILNHNCVLEIDGLHYVFDKTDIYVHDGVQPRSIVHGRNKDFIFTSLVKDLSHLAFVTFDPNLNEVAFCYVSQDRLVGFLGATTGCNRAAVYNINRDTWTFYDLPNVTSATFSKLSYGLSYADAAVSYAEMGGSYLGDGDENSRSSIYVGRKDTALGLTKPRIYGSDLLSGGKLAKPIETETIKDAFVERTMIDLDETGAPLTAYKSMLRIYPQVAVRGGSSVKFQFGANDVLGVEPQWGLLQSFDPATDHKIDVRNAGRYLAYRFTQSGLSDFSLTGFDASLTLRGRR